MSTTTEKGLLMDTRREDLQGWHNLMKCAVGRQKFNCGTNCNKISEIRPWQTCTDRASVLPICSQSMDWYTPSYDGTQNARGFSVDVEQATCCLVIDYKRNVRWNLRQNSELSSADVWHRATRECWYWEKGNIPRRSSPTWRAPEEHSARISVIFRMGEFR